MSCCPECRDFETIKRLHTMGCGMYQPKWNCSCGAHRYFCKNTVCPCHTKEKQEQSWRERYREAWGEEGYNRYDRVKFFIESELEVEREKVKQQTEEACKPMIHDRSYKEGAAQKLAEVVAMVERNLLEEDWRKVDDGYTADVKVRIANQNSIHNRALRSLLTQLQKKDNPPD